MRNWTEAAAFSCALSLTLMGGCGKTHSVTPGSSAAGSVTHMPAGGSSGSGGMSTTGGTGTGGSGGNLPTCPGAEVKCLDPLTAQYCDATARLTAVDCSLGMATEGFVSNGCESNAAGDGCTVDDFLDPDCQAGTPPFTACLGGGVDDLLDVYAACFTNLNQAQEVVSCYADFMDETDTLVDCNAAQAACARP